ncbi:MAG: ATP-dependent DNA helicase RecG [Flavobacteriales bacterium]|nr:ATP-dependent DNA helicase RecG [Flavobacteriales bacterium]
MNQSFLDTPIEYVKGVGPSRADAFKSELGIYKMSDLLEYYPFRHIDRTVFHTVTSIDSEAFSIQLKGRIVRLKELGTGRATRLSATFQDDTGQIELLWFKGIKWVKPKIKADLEYVIYGKPTQFKGTWNIAHPDLEVASNVEKLEGGRFQAVYSSSEKLGKKGLNSAGISKVLRNAIAQLPANIEETLPESMIASLGFPSRRTAIINMHAPQRIEDYLAALERLKFEELFFLQLVLLRQKLVNTKRTLGARFPKVGELFTDFYQKHLGFELTGAQKRVMKEVRLDVNSGYHMNRLIQGDVGSGKTIVALLAGLLAIDNGYQVCLMAPTEILAQQHYEGFQKMLAELPAKVALLTGSVKTAARRAIHEGLESGEINILIGTHALIEPKVKFKCLGMAIIDEQHRFGVAQRAKLWAKATLPPHVLVMTATPIPRTLAMTMYGDLDISVIDELPPGRKAIKTVHRTDAHRLSVFAFLKDEIKKGRQVYVVYPLIEESQSMDYKDLMDGYESISRSFPMPEYKISIVHGKMKPEDKDYEMKRFARGETQLLVATTVIEVGVNVPNASVMVIESTERFGLSQLHQLRGRVGRGAEQSYCILMSGQKLSSDARTRIKTMCDTNDGFKISEVDLELRGPGDIMGTQQSGLMNFKLANLATDQVLLSRARQVAIALIDEDPDLTDPKNSLIAIGLKKALKQRKDWSKIS